MGYKFYWIPYFSSVGYFWNADLGFDAITLQPNHFFADPNDNTFGAGGTTIIGTTAQWNADLGFDAITLQPNHFFADPNDNTFGAGGTTIIGTTAQIGAYAGLGVEMEFDGRLTSDVDKYNQGLDYLNGAVEYGFDGPEYYRNWYEGGGAIDDCAESRNPVIREDKYNQGLDYLNGAVEYGFDGPEYYRNWYEGGGAIDDCAESRNPVIREFYDNIYQLINGTYEPREYITDFSVIDPDNLLAGKAYTTSLTIGDPNQGQGHYIDDDEGQRLTDGLFAGQNYNKGRDNREFADFTFDLGSSKAFQQINVGTLANEGWGISRPSRIQIQVSNEAGEDNWQTIYDGEVDDSVQTDKVFTFRTENGEKIIARYLRFNIYFGQWTWISMDEIQVYDKNTGSAADGALTVPGEQPTPAETPSITTDLPDKQEATVGLPLTLSVEASVSDGGTLSYQWYKDNTVIGENSNSLTIDKVLEQDAGTYKVVVTNTLNNVTASSTSTSCEVTVTETANILKDVKYTTSLRDGGANAGLGDFHDEHPDVERVKLTDGVYSNSWGDSTSVGYHKRTELPVDLTFHLSDTPKTFQQIKIGAFSPDANGILLPSNIKIEIKKSANEDWIIIYDAPTEGSLGVDKRFSLTAEEGVNLEATDIRFTLQPGSSWLFLDEIEALQVADGSASDGTLKEVAPPSGQNIALNRPYTTTFASGTNAYYPNNPDSGYELTNGINVGNAHYLNTEWTGYLNAEAVTHRFDFGETATFTAVKAHIYTGNMDGITTAQSYTVQVSNDGIHWETVYDEPNATGQDWLTYRAPEEGIRGRFVQITMKTGRMLFMDEIEIWGEGGKELEPEPDPDIVANQAKGKAYYLYAFNPNNSSATFPDADEAAWPDTNGNLLTDGVLDKSGDWQQNKSQWVSWQKGSGDMNVSVEMDLGTEKAIHEITTHFVQDTDNKVGLPSNMQVFVSNQRNGDDINWIKLYDEAVPASSGTTVDVTYTVSEIYRARYIKLVFKQETEYMGLGEIEINGKGNTDGAVDPIDLISKDLVNLSKGKEYTLSDANTQYPDTNGELTDGKFASGGAEDAAWTGFAFTPGGAKYITLDLGDTYLVSKFSANFLTKSGTSVLPKNVQFIVSQDGENWSTVYNGKSLSSSSDTYKAQAFLGTPVKARYVMYYLYNDSGVALIDEIEVSGDPTPVDPDVTPPTPPEEVENYLIPGEATGGIANLAILDTAAFQNAGNTLEQGFDGVAVTGDASSYGKILSDLNQKASGKLKVVLEADASTLDDVISAFEAGSYSNLELAGILVTADLAEADALTTQIHAKSLKAFWLGSYNASGIENWKDHGIDAAICQADSASNLTAAAKTAKENGLGMALDMSKGYDNYLDYLDAAVKDSFQGKYVFRAYNMGALNGTDEQNARMLESTEKLMKGTLKVSNRNTPATPTVAETYSTWVSLKATNGYEYSKDGSSWTIDPVFTGLTPETSYTFYQRVKETHNAEASLMSAGLTVTTPATPTETVPPTFTTNLSSTKSAQVGDVITFSVKAVSNSGGTLSYQWYKNGSAIAGATGDSYTISSVSLSDGGIYYVDVTDESNGTHILSNSCTLTVSERDVPSGGGSSGGWDGGSTSKPDVIVGDWEQLSDGSWQYVEDNQPVTGWKSIHSTWYYFNSDGIMVTGWFKDGGYWYYLKSSGAMATGWVQVDGNWYYLKEDGRMATGWLKLGNVWYYLKSNGIMATGWLQEGSTWYYLYDWGGMANTSWVQVNGSWYYFRGNGAMTTGWLQLGSNWYYLKSSGAMATGWNWIGNNCYYFNQSGKMAANTTVGGYKLDATGAWVK